MRKCIRPFKSEYFDETWSLGDPISDEDFEKLSFEEKGYFSSKKDDNQDIPVDKVENYLENNFPGITGDI